MIYTAHGLDDNAEHGIYWQNCHSSATIMLSCFTTVFGIECWAANLRPNGVARAASSFLDFFVDRPWGGLCYVVQATGFSTRE